MLWGIPQPNFTEVSMELCIALSILAGLSMVIAFITLPFME